MNEKIKTQWIEALESGEYVQVTGHLCVGSTMCCLGVLTDIYIKENGFKWKEDSSIKIKSFDNEISCTPDRVMDWAGLKDRNPQVMYNGSSEPIAKLNDDGLSFFELSKIIQQQL